MAFSNIIRAASAYAVLLLLSMALASESLPTVDSYKKGDSDRANGECGQLFFEGSSGTIYSPNYPANYAQNNIDCRYFVNPGTGSQVLLRFNDFSTEQGFDLVEIYDTYNIQVSPRSYLFSGNSVPSSFLSTGPYVVVRFSTDSSISDYKGFNITFVAV